MRSSAIIRRPAPALLATAFSVFLAHAGAAGDRRCSRVDLEIARSEAGPTQYAEFCSRQPAACDLSGSAVIDWETAHPHLAQVNRAVNAEITLVPDRIGEGAEECWEFPVRGPGDCEDFALEKRRRLVARGLPSAALTMAIVHHETRFFAHAVLLAETTRGTWMLDNLSDEVVCWDAAPYRYERRERPDGNWDRYIAR